MTRGEDIARVAESLGLGYLEAASSTEVDTRDALPSWAEGLWENVMIGTYEGSEVVAFDWAGWAWGGAGAYSMGAPVKSMFASCALTQLPASVPFLKVIAPRRLKPWGRVRLGDRRFDRLFRIETRDKSFAQALLHPGCVRSCLVRIRTRPGSDLATAASRLSCRGDGWHATPRHWSQNGSERICLSR
jgi:hypothetical protein